MDKKGKPLREWTLDEVQSECDSHNDDCKGCQLHGVICRHGVTYAPYSWVLYGDGKRFVTEFATGKPTP